MAADVSATVVEVDDGFLHGVFVGFSRRGPDHGCTGRTARAQTRIFGRADHPWEGVGSYTNVGGNEHWRRFISGLNARERQYFRFPPPSDELYTADTLERLEELAACSGGLSLQISDSVPQWQLFFIPNHHSSMDESVGAFFENHAIFEENNFSLSCAISDWVVPGEDS